MEPKRRAVVSSYATHFSPPESRYIHGVEASAHTGAVINKVRVDVCDTPFYEQLDIAALLPNRDTPEEDTSNDGRFRLKLSRDDYIYHNRIARVKFSAR